MVGCQPTAQGEDLMKQRRNIEMVEEAFRLARIQLETTIEQLHSDTTAQM